VQWEVVLQEKKSRRTTEGSPAPDAAGESLDEEEEEQEETTEKNEDISEEYGIEGDPLDDFQSNPTGSLDNSHPQTQEDLELRADLITEKLLQEVLNDFKRDGKVKLEVEDTDDSEFQDKWPWTEDRKVEPEPEQTFAPPVSAQAEEDKPQSNQVAQENEQKKRHDELMKKYHEE